MMNNFVRVSLTIAGFSSRRFDKASGTTQLPACSSSDTSRAKSMVPREDMGGSRWSPVVVCATQFAVQGP